MGQLTSIERQVEERYRHGSLGRAIRETLVSAGKSLDALTPDDLAPVDEFHIGGREATVAFVDRLGLRPGMRVLDIGCGIGGPARTVAARYGCQVTGVDLAAEFCDVAAELTDLVDLGGRITYRQASAVALPFSEAAFDAAYMLHVGMNVSDKAALLAEARRALKPGGAFGIYDVLAGPAGAPHYPVPWAETPATSYLVSVEELVRLLEEAGFEIAERRDRTRFGIDFFTAMRARRSAEGLPQLGLHLVMGPLADDMVANMQRNLEEARVAPWEVICRRR